MKLQRTKKKRASRQQPYNLMAEAQPVVANPLGPKRAHGFEGTVQLKQSWLPPKPIPNRNRCRS